MTVNGPRLFRLFVHPLLAILFPTPCGGCGELLGARQDAGYCAGCWSTLQRDPVPPRNPLVCNATCYAGLARDLLLQAKFRGRPELFRPLGRRMAAIGSITGVDRGMDLVVAVPSHPLTRLRRGYNPAGELARTVAGCLGLPLAGRGLRRRLAYLSPARRAGREARRVAAGRGFAAPAGMFSDRRILLVDDILTTGATYHGCRTALLEAGAAEVRLLVWARTPGGSTLLAGGTAHSYNDPHPGYIY